jgi:hypothetical protein
MDNHNCSNSNPTILTGLVEQGKQRYEKIVEE